MFYVSISLWIIPSDGHPPTVWAWDGYGHSKNLVKNVKEAEGKHSIIVSRSHAGEIEKVAKESFGDNVEIVPAGGAGAGFFQD